MTSLQAGDLGKAIAESAVDNAQLRDVNEAIRGHAIEQVGKKLRGYMTDMKRIAPHRHHEYNGGLPPNESENRYWKKPKIVVSFC